MGPRWCGAGRSWRWRFWASPKPSSTFAAASHVNGDRQVCGPDVSNDRTDGETKMEVILLERVGKLGQMGDVVRVKDGFARNFLLPKGKALRATEENRSRFENMKVDLEARNLYQTGEGEKMDHNLHGQNSSVV